MVERDHAFRQIVAEAADIADRKGFSCCIHREVGMADAVDLARCDDGAGAGAVQCSGEIVLPPELRQQCGNQARAVRGEHRQDEFHSVWKL